MSRDQKIAASTLLAWIGMVGTFIFLFVVLIQNVPSIGLAWIFFGLWVAAAAVAIRLKKSASRNISEGP